MKWFIALAVILFIGCGEHPESKARRERIRSFNVPQEAEPQQKDDGRDKAISQLQGVLDMRREQVADLQAQLAAATKGGFTGCKFYTSKNCGPCRLLEAHLKAKGWTVGPSDKFHFWKIDTDDAEKHPLVPHLVYFNDGKQLKGEIVGYDGSEKSLLQIIAKQPVSSKGVPKAAYFQRPGEQEQPPVEPIQFSSEVIYYEPAPVYVETFYQPAVQWQVGPFYGYVW